MCLSKSQQDRFAMTTETITDCGDDGCEGCDVCRYLNFLEWARSVGKPDGSTIERNDAIEAHLRANGINI